MLCCSISPPCPTLAAASHPACRSPVRSATLYSMLSEYACAKCHLHRPVSWRLCAKRRQLRKKATDYADFADFNPCNPFNPWLILTYCSKASTLIIAAPKLLPTQSVGGFVELSTFTRRTLVMRGRRYSVISPVWVLSRTM